MSHPLVSIIIPTYNAKDFIRETIDSALRQSYEHIEVILVDDGSTDSTRELFDEFKEKGVRCFTIENAGASQARNFGQEQAKGEFIQFLDSDDLLHPQKIELQLHAMIKEGANISFSKWVNFRHSTQENRQFRFRNLNYAAVRTGKQLLESFGMDNWFIPVFSWLTSRKLLENAGVWNIEISNNDDGEFFSRVLYGAEGVICIDRVLAYYRTLEVNSLSKLNNEEKINSAFMSYQLIEQMLSSDLNKNLLSYPKRLYYTQFLLIREDFPRLAERAAKAFDSLKVDCFLSRKKKFWKLIRWFGLYRGYKIYNYLIKFA